MPKRGRNLLSAKTVLAIKKPGRHSDGGGLFLVIRDRDGSLSRSWAYIYKRGRRGEAKERFVGLGAVLDVTLAQAREKAALCRDAVSAGGDPWEAVKPATQVPTFGKVADDMVADLMRSRRAAALRQS